uniref:Uncharacterized protein n=2 Tax=Panagrellus redivivus TaxID=6233 RepID=A0A7E4VBT7_PANRE
MAIDMTIRKEAFKESSPTFFANKNSPLAWEEFLKDTEDFFVHHKKRPTKPSINSHRQQLQSTSTTSRNSKTMATATLPQDFAMRFPQQLTYPPQSHGGNRSAVVVENNNEQGSEHSGAPRESATSGSPGSTDLELSSNQSNFGTSSNISPVSRTASVVFANPTANNFGGNNFGTDANENASNTVITEANSFHRAGNTLFWHFLYSLKRLFVRSHLFTLHNNSQFPTVPDDLSRNVSGWICEF